MELLHHTLSSGNETGDLFLGDEDRNHFFSFMGGISNPFDVDVLAQELLDKYAISYPEQKDQSFDL